LTESLFKWRDHLAPTYEEGENLRKYEDEVSWACQDASSYNMDACLSYDWDDAFLFRVGNVHSFNRKHAINAFNYSFEGQSNYSKMLIQSLAH